VEYIAQFRTRLNLLLLSSRIRMFTL